LIQFCFDFLLVELLQLFLALSSQGVPMLAQKLAVLTHCLFDHRGRERIRETKSDEISHSLLTPVRQVAPANTCGSVFIESNERKWSTPPACFGLSNPLGC